MAATGSGGLGWGRAAASPSYGPLEGASLAVTASDTIVLRWNAAVLDAVRGSSLGPPVVARALAIVHTCIYDAWAAYDPVASGTRYGNALRRPASERTELNKTEAISYAAHRSAVDLFPDRRSEFDRFMRSLGYPPERGPSGNSPAGIGVRAAEAVLRYRHHDGANQLGDLSPGPYSDYTGYVPANDPMVVAEPIDPATVRDPDRWQPLTYPNRSGRLVTPSCLAPHWTFVKPFALHSGGQFRLVSGSPARHGSRAYRRQAEELLDISAGLTDRQKAIAEYWADGPNSEQPPGHWQLFAGFVSRRDNHTLDQDAKLFFLTTNAVFDAGIAAWDVKRAFDYVRPITAIRHLFRGRRVTAWAGPGLGTGSIDGGTWVPYQPTWFPTPPFAEFVSGHSTFSAAAAEVLKNFTGRDEFGYSAVVRAGSSFVEPGITPAEDVRLYWPTFSAAADSAGISRRYGGIHFAHGDLAARRLGRLVGVVVWAKAVRLFFGLG